MRNNNNTLWKKLRSFRWWRAWPTNFNRVHTCMQPTHLEINSIWSMVKRARKNTYIYTYVIFRLIPLFISRRIIMLYRAGASSFFLLFLPIFFKSSGNLCIFINNFRELNYIIGRRNKRANNILQTKGIQILKITHRVYLTSFLHSSAWGGAGFFLNHIGRKKEEKKCERKIISNRKQVNTS